MGHLTSRLTPSGPSDHEYVEWRLPEPTQISITPSGAPVSSLCEYWLLKSQLPFSCPRPNAGCLPGRSRAPQSTQHPMTPDSYELQKVSPLVSRCNQLHDTIHSLEVPQREQVKIITSQDHTLPSLSFSARPVSFNPLFLRTRP